MSQPDGEHQLAVLREGIQHSGRLTSRLRQVGAGAGAMAAPSLLMILLALSGAGLAPWEAMAVLGAFGLVIGLFVGVPVSLMLLRERRSQLRRRLMELPREQQVAVLLPLRSARGDTRRLVAPLLRELHASTELTPAAAPPGRGDEATPTE